MKAISKKIKFIQSLHFIFLTKEQVYVLKNTDRIDLLSLERE